MLAANLHIFDSGMSTEITYIEAEANLETLCTRVVETGEVIVITRPNGKNAVLISEAELESLLETLYLLRSPANATRLLTALKRAKSRVTQPQTLDEICQKFGLDEEAKGLDPSEQVMLEGMRQHHRYFAEAEW